MRIVSGTAKGKNLASFTGRQIRPTSDRVRESIFNILYSHLGPCAGKSVLDLFAGTGAMAIEALSRGARRAVLVDSGQQAAQLIPANLRACRLDEKAVFHRSGVLETLPRLKPERFDLIFLDPPYGQGLAAGTIQAIADHDLLTPDGILCAETAREEEVPEQAGPLEWLQTRRYGATSVHFFALLRPEA
ncbi:MAG: 16S rRNA (guanine(966)-N(2))-methyltransferase RsmD [Desulfuromonadales bacterium]